MLTFIASIPARVWEYGLVALACLLIAVGFIHHEREVGRQKEHELRLHEQAAVAAAGAQAASAAASETARREAAISEAAHATQVAASAVAADADIARRERDALRVQLAEIRRHAVPSNSAASQGSQDQLGGDPIGVLADVLDRADARARILAEVADHRRVTAEACERYEPTP